MRVYKKQRNANGIFLVFILRKRKGKSKDEQDRKTAKSGIGSDCLNSSYDLLTH